MEKTNAIRILDRANINYKIHNYVGSGFISGMDVCNYLKEDPDRAFKTLVTIGKSKAYHVFLIPVSGTLDLKKAAQAVNEKNIEMVKFNDLLKITGYVHGGCSPIGMKKEYDTIVDVSAQNHETIYMSGGKIGIQVEISLAELSKIIKYRLADIKCDNVNRI